MFAVLGLLFLVGCVGILHLDYYTETFMACISYPKTLDAEDCVSDYIAAVSLQAKVPAYWESVLDYAVVPQDAHWALAENADLLYRECPGGQCRKAVALMRTYEGSAPVIALVLYTRELRTTDGVTFLYDPYGHVEAKDPDLVSIAIRQKLEENAPLTPTPVRLRVYK